VLLWYTWFSLLFSYVCLHPVYWCIPYHSTVFDWVQSSHLHQEQVVLTIALLLFVFCFLGHDDCASWPSSCSLLSSCLRMVSAKQLRLRSCIKTAESWALTVTSQPFIFALKSSAIFWRWQCILSNPVINQDYTFFEMLPPRHYTLTTLPVNFIGQYLHWRQSIGLSFIWPSNVSMNQNATPYPSLYTNGYHAQSSLVGQICPCAIMQSKLLLTFLLWAPRQLQIWKDLPEQLHKHQLQKAISSILHDLLAFGSAPTNLLLHHMPNGPPSTLWCATLFRLETIILW